MYRSIRPLFPLVVLSIVLLCCALPLPAQTVTTVASFSGSNGTGPQASLIVGSDGNLYGTTVNGGANNAPACNTNNVAGCGTVFRVTPGGVLSTVYSFCNQPNCGDGAQPYGSLVKGIDGNFYGTTSLGGGNNKGTVFKLTVGGTESTLHSFAGSDGAQPQAGLILASDGNFYGTTSTGGTGGDGTIFRINSSGTLSTVYNLNASNGEDGSAPGAPLLQASDQNFYGTTRLGGANRDGVVFKVTASGSYTTLHSFDGADGIAPSAGLIQGTDGNLYSTTYTGGASNQGTVFKITTGGALTTLTSLGNTGYAPVAALVQGADGNFYGTTTLGGGASSAGTIFKITPGGALTTLYKFCSQSGCADGQYPGAGLILAGGINFYGTTVLGGAHGDGTVFNLQLVDTLTVSIIGDGTVTSADGFIDCPGTCSYNYPTGTPVTLSATASQDWVFGGWNGGCLGTRPCTLTMTQPVTLDAIFSQALKFVAVAPCRLIDTRTLNNPIQGGTSRNFIIPQLGGCNIPDSAAAYSLNVTVAPQGPLGYLSIWPTGENQPVVSTMNSLDGRIKANAAIVPAGTNGGVSIFASNTTDVLLDIDGFFTASTSRSDQFYPLPPCRVIDTRHGGGSFGAPSLTGGVERDFPILTSPCIPSGINPQAYSLNVTVAPNPVGQPLGYLTIWPQGETQPTVSTLNNPTATLVANAAIVPAGNNGAIAVLASNNTDLVVDITGYFAAPGTGGLSLYSTAPCRVLDTRGVGSGNPIVGQYPVHVAASVCSPPATAEAYVFNATVVPPGALGYLSLWPDGTMQPVVSTLNALDGLITSNMAIVPTLNGSIDAFASNLTQLVLDISSYFAP